MAGIAERLQAHGRTQQFGVRLIRNRLTLEHELLPGTDRTHADAVVLHRL